MLWLLELKGSWGSVSRDRDTVTIAISSCIRSLVRTTLLTQSHEPPSSDL